MALGTFSATVDAWAQKSQKRMEAIWKQASQKTVSIGQSRILVDTGFARASARASKSSMPPVEAGSRGQKGASYPYDPGDVILTIAGAKLGQTIYVGWTASYVGFIEDKTGFVRLAAMQWQHTVSEVVGEAKTRVG